MEDKQAVTMATGVVNDFVTSKKQELGQLRPDQSFETCQVVGDSESVAFIGTVKTHDPEPMPERRPPVKLRVVK